MFRRPRFTWFSFETGSSQTQRMTPGAKFPETTHTLMPQMITPPNGGGGRFRGRRSRDSRRRGGRDPSPVVRSQRRSGSGSGHLSRRSGDRFPGGKAGGDAVAVHGGSRAPSRDLAVGSGLRRERGGQEPVWRALPAQRGRLDLSSGSERAKTGARLEGCGARHRIHRPGFRHARAADGRNRGGDQRLRARPMGCGASPRAHDVEGRGCRFAPGETAQWSSRSGTVAKKEVNGRKSVTYAWIPARFDGIASTTAKIRSGCIACKQVVRMTEKSCR